MRAPIDGSVCLVTGASSGIGAAIARELAPRAAAMALVARREDKLRELADELRSVNAQLQVMVQPCDLTDRTATDAMLEAVNERLGDVDILVNNAGFGDMGMFDRASWAKTERMIELNVTASVYLTHRLVGSMVARRRGGILMVSSAFGVSFLPGFAGYIGTKQFITGFTEALRLDLRSSQVVVTQICPGPVGTEFEQNIGNFVGGEAHHVVQISAERCARAAVRGLERDRALVIPGLLVRFLLLLDVISPRWLKRLLFAPGAKWMRATQERALDQASDGESE